MTETVAVVEKEAETPVTQGEQVQVVAPVKKGKKAPATSGNYIQDTAQKIENLKKDKALSTALELRETIDTSFFELGGVLSIIKSNQWYEGHKNFAEYVDGNFDFGVRKADYLIGIYESLVTKDIPWDKVADLKWTKLSLLAKLLTQENVDEWVAKALPLTVEELKAILKPAGPEGSTDANGKATSDVVIKKFLLHSDQVETVTEALQKCKVELNTDADNVALHAICLGYLGGTTAIPADVASTLQALGVNGAIELFNSAFPDKNLSLDDVVPVGENS